MRFFFIAKMGYFFVKEKKNQSKTINYEANNKCIGFP